MTRRELWSALQRGSIPVRAKVRGGASLPAIEVADVERLAARFGGGGGLEEERKVWEHVRDVEGLLAERVLECETYKLRLAEAEKRRADVEERLLASERERRREVLDARVAAEVAARLVEVEDERLAESARARALEARAEELAQTGEALTLRVQELEEQRDGLRHRLGELERQVAEGADSVQLQRVQEELHETRTRLRLVEKLERAGGRYTDKLEAKLGGS